uniref:Uncharacterized protein n=1 Tax=Caenorhabditis japonica TaxID=281687 RepID=A0A8R1IHR7_CAEJA
MLECRIILLLLILLPIIALSSPYEYKIPNVAFPNIKGKEFKPPTPREAGADGESIDSREDDDVKTWRIDQMPLHTFRLKEYPLTDEEIEELDKSTDVKVSKEAWKLFNQNADVFIIDSKTTKDSYKVFAFRRAVINTKLLEEVTGLKNETWTIDVFEDYQVFLN